MQQHDSMPLSTLSTERQGGGTVASAGVSLMEVSTFMTEQLKAVARMEARMDKQASEAKAEMEAQRLENDRLRAEAAETRVETVVREIASAKSCVSEGQLEMLQTRLDALHEAKLLSDDEVGALEDCVADYIDCCSSLNPAAAEIGAAAEKVKKMVGLSEGMGKDGMLARQLRRKFAVGQ
jgi:type I site-specific restriction endonuclease